MRGKEKCIIFSLCIALAVCIALLIYGNTEPVSKPLQPAVEISLSVSKERVASLIEENGVKLPIKARAAMAVIPDTLTLVFDTEKGNKNALSELRINGQKVSHEILENICENYLDFSCTLVYNRT